MPCKQKNDRIEREKYVRENRVDVDLYENVTDPVEILKIIHQPKEHNSLINYLPYKYSVTELYEKLDEENISELIEYALENINVTAGIINKQNETALSIACELAAFTNADLSKIQFKLIEMEEYYPALIFRNASPEIAQLLISKVSSNPGHILSALSFISTPNVISEFAEWRRNSPKWRDQLYIPPERYAHNAGWELDEKSNTRNLILEECYPLIAKTSENNNSPAQTCKTSNCICKWCNNKLTNIFEFDLTDNHLDFIPFTQNKLIISTCEVCAAYGDHLFMRIGEDGNSTWHEKNVRPDYLPYSHEYDRMPTNKLSLSFKPRLKQHSADWLYTPTTFSQIGGLPSWIQDFNYPECPACNKSMIFIAQLSGEDIEEWGEGIYYAHLCPECSVTTVTYQQT